MLINNAVRTLLSGNSTATARSGVHWSLTDPALVVPLDHLAGLHPGRALLPQLDAGRPEVHHELRHPPHRHPGDDRLGELEARVLELVRLNSRPGWSLRDQILNQTGLLEVRDGDLQCFYGISSRLNTFTSVTAPCRGNCASKRPINVMFASWSGW